MDPKERAIRELYEARARRDWEAVGKHFADEIGYHEPGEEDHSGDFRGRDEVVALLQKLVAVTEGTFQLEPEAFLNLEQHSAVLVRWWAERKELRSEGREIAVYRFDAGKIAEVWFYNEPSEQEPFSAVFAFDWVPGGMWTYKYTGKAATFTVTLPAYNVSKSVTLKSNGYVVVSFSV